MNRILLLAGLLSASGCAWTNDTMPRAPIEFARSDYELGEDTTGYACRNYAFGIAWGALFGRDTTSFGSRGVLGLLAGERVTPEATEAMFKALERSDRATHLIAPRVRNTFGGFGTVALPLFGKRCGEVWARTAVIGGPIDRVPKQPETCPPSSTPPSDPTPDQTEPDESLLPDVNESASKQSEVEKSDAEETEPEETGEADVPAPEIRKKSDDHLDVWKGRNPEEEQ